MSQDGFFRVAFTEPDCPFVFGVLIIVLEFAVVDRFPTVEDLVR